MTLRTSLTALGLAASSMVVPMAPATAAGATHALCTLSAVVHFTPGVTGHTPVSGTGTTYGQTGVIRCNGTVRGARVTGPGTFGYAGTFEDITCLADRVPLRGDYEAVVPTTAGPMTLQGTIVDTRIAVAAWFTLTGDDHRLGGLSLVLNKNGDCILNPTTLAQVSIAGVLSGG